MTSSPALSGMDRPRTAIRKRTPVLIAVVAAAALIVVLASLGPAASPVERSSLVIDTVRRGPFIHDIAAAGTLVAEQARVIAAPSAGRIEAVLVQAGDRLARGEVILELSNRDTLRQLLEAEQQVAGAEADLADVEATLQARSLESEMTVRRTEFEKQDARRQADAAAELSREGLISELEAVRLRERAAEVDERVVTEGQRHAALTRSAGAQLSAQRNRLARLRALEEFHRSIAASLVVRAPAEAMLRDIAVQEGEWVTEGQRLLRLVEPGRLKAVLLVPEGVAHEVRPGQQVTLNARGLALQGQVNRIAAAVEQGTLAVDVRIDGDLPSGARPESSVEGRIRITEIHEALSLTRSSTATAGASAVLYKLDQSGRTARRATLVYGPASVERIVVLDGAAPGDRFIVAGIEDTQEPVIRLE